jgi:hypothetical protein
MKTTGPGDLPVQAHLFEYTTSFALTPEYAYDFGAKGKAPIMPCQIMFCRARAEPLVIPTSLCSARRRYDPRTQVDLPAVEGL